MKSYKFGKNVMEIPGQAGNDVEVVGNDGEEFNR